MSYFQKTLAYFYVFLTLLFSSQVYSASCLDLEFNSHNKAGFEWHDVKYNLIDSTDQKQGQGKTHYSCLNVVKLTKNNQNSLTGGPTSKNLILLYCYYSDSSTIILNLTNLILVFPFHFFG
jgi:hypothetical protein